jgi:hypothetical protein
MASAFLAVPTAPDVGLHITRREVYGGMNSHPGFDTAIGKVAGHGQTLRECWLTFDW